MNVCALVVAALKMVLPAGTASDPSAVAPVELTGEPVSFWWDSSALHVGERTFAWKELGVTPADGAKFKVGLGRSALREPIDFEGEIGLSAAKVRVPCFGPIGGSDIRAKVEVLCPRAGQVFCCLYGTGATQDYLNLPATRNVKVGGKAEFDMVGRGSSSGHGYCTIRDVDGRTIYNVNGQYRTPGMIFDFKYIWTDAAKKVMHVRTAGWTDDEGYSLRVSARDYMTGTIVSDWTRTVPLGRIWGEREYEIGVGDLAPGFYWLHLDHVAPDGKVAYTEKAPYLRPSAKMPWEGNTLGTEDTVPPPWTAPTFAPDGTFTCWNRTVKLGGAGLVTSIVNGGKELLTAPITLSADGRALTFDVSRGMVKKSEAEYVLKAREADVTVKAVCEFDGLVRFEAAFPTDVKSLVWRVAASREHVTGFDDCSSERNPNVLLPKGKALSFSFDPSARHMWWMPGARGLMGGVLNLHGWHAKDLANAGRVEATADEIAVSTMFVDCAMPAGPRRTVSFYIEPTPVKPKDLKLASVDATKIINWTGHVCQYFEIKYPGFENPVLVKRFEDELKKGNRVFWYNGSSGVSPEDPFWNWYREDWNMKGLDYFAHEAPRTGRPSWRRGVWAYGCLNSDSFFDYKVWGVNWYLNELCPGEKDLYFDLANPHPCSNGHHGCRWRDDFGREMRDMAIMRTRELHKRVYRLVKAKNPDGTMFGHVSSKMCPSGVFFDMITAGEGYAYEVVKNGYTYFDVFTPENMQSFFVPRAQETVMMTSPQLLRARECWAPHLYRTYDCNTPENVRAIRHASAYIKIHDIIMERHPHDREGWQFYKIDSAIRRLRYGGVYSAYYLEGEPYVTLSRPGPRQLWAWFAKGGDGVLVLLNDTDAEVVQTVSVKGLSAKGEEILDKGAFDFTSGSCVIRLPPRDARFIRFGK